MRRKTVDRLLGLAGWALVWLVLAFILLPAVVVAIASLNGTSILQFPPQSWSFRWFVRVFEYRDFASGFRNGLIVTLWASVISTLFGAAFAYAIHRYDFRGKTTLEAVLLSPLVIPHFVIGLGILMLAAATALPRGYAIVVFTHVLIVLPFVVRSTYVSLENLEMRYELAAASLGASPWRVLGTVTLPLLVPGLVSGWLFSAILSFNEFTASLFVTSQSTQTLPVAMYNYVREYADPTLAAISVLYILATATMLVVVNKFFRLEKVLNVE